MNEESVVDVETPQEETAEVEENVIEEENVFVSMKDLPQDEEPEKK